MLFVRFLEEFGGVKKVFLKFKKSKSGFVVCGGLLFCEVDVFSKGYVC